MRSSKRGVPNRNRGTSSMSVYEDKPKKKTTEELEYELRKHFGVHGAEALIAYVAAMFEANASQPAEEQPVQWEEEDPQNKHSLVSGSNDPVGINPNPQNSQSTV
jgi:hypothetical protein